MNPELKIVIDDNFDKEFHDCIKSFERMMVYLNNFWSKTVSLEFNYNFSLMEKKDIRHNIRLLKSTVTEILITLRNRDIRRYFLSTYRGETLRHKIIRLLHSVMDLTNIQENFTESNFPFTLEVLFNDVHDLYCWLLTYQEHLNIESVHYKKNFALTQQVLDLRALLEKANSRETELIYSQASAKYLDSARVYEIIFYIIFVGAIIVTIVSFKHFPYSSINLVDFILYKVLTVTIVLTTGTIFLRKASHLRKQHDQAHQTSMELQALPLYLRNVKSDDHSEIYKNLAEKYFGKEIDQTQTDKIGDLMQDQLAAGTELIKASAELVKSVKPTSSSTVQE